MYAGCDVNFKLIVPKAEKLIISPNVQFHSSERIMVEAAGIEPASEDRATQTSNQIMCAYKLLHSQQSCNMIDQFFSMPAGFGTVQRIVGTGVYLISILNREDIVFYQVFI
jgi:hypothetical protein